MKKITFLFSCILLSVITANAVVTFPVDYTSFFAASAINSNGTSLETGNAAAVGTWVVGNAGTNAVSPTVAVNNLSYSTYIDNNAGKKISLASLTTGSTARTTAYYLTSTTSELTSGPYYLSFLLNVSSITGSALNIISFGNASTGGSLRGRVYIKAVTDGYQLGATIDGTPLSYYTTATLTTGTNYLIVLKHKIDLASATVGSGTTSIFVNPTPGATEPTSANATATESAAVTGLDCIKTVVVSQNVGVAAEIAGLRMGTSWEDVVKSAGGPKLTTPTVAAATAVTASGFNVNWTPVANALGYSVKVYKNGSLISTVNANGQSASTVSVSGLSNALVYTYTVTALGDVTNFSNSDASPVQKVIMPLNYSTFFAPTAVGSGETALETGNASVVNTWTLAGTANGANPAISANDLSYSNYIDNMASKKISLADVTAQRSSLFYLTSSATDLTAGTYYVSFLLRVSTPPTTSGSTLLSFTNSNTGGQRGRLNIMGFGAGYQLAASLTGSSAYYSSTLTFGTTYLVVLKQNILIASATAGEATNSIFINPVIGESEPAANAEKYESGITSLDCIKGVAINQQPGLTAEIAGLRFSTNWSDLVVSSTTTNLEMKNNSELRYFDKHILAPESGRFDIYNLQGIRVQSVENRNEVSLSALKGIYVVKFTAANGNSLYTKVSMR